MGFQGFQKLSKFSDQMSAFSVSVSISDEWLLLTIFSLSHLFFVEYRVLRHLGEGTFSEVLKAESVKTRQKVAIKCMKSHFDKIEQVLLIIPPKSFFKPIKLYKSEIGIELKKLYECLKLTCCLFLGAKFERNQSITTSFSTSSHNLAHWGAIVSANPSKLNQSFFSLKGSYLHLMFVWSVMNQQADLHWSSNWWRWTCMRQSKEGPTTCLRTESSFTFTSY